MFFFFKQRTAYEVRLSLVGSEMCIRARPHTVGGARFHPHGEHAGLEGGVGREDVAEGQCRM